MKKGIYLESSTLVSADLRARSGDVTFIYILTGSVVYKLKAWATVTVEASFSVNT